MVRRKNLCAEGVSPYLGDASSLSIPQRRRRLLLKTSCQPRDNCFGLHLQNVASFPTHPEHCASWFCHFRQREARRTISLVLLQKTRVTIGESDTMETLYNSYWGYMHKLGPSFWTESEHSCGGVAILLNPYLSVTEMVPWSEEHWTPQWMAVCITLLGETILVVNVYAPSIKTERESMFKGLLLLLQGYEGRMFVGGDFNCTLEPRHDRSFVLPPGRHYSLALRQLLGRAQLSGVRDDDMEIAEEERSVPAFQAAAHTYSYTMPGGGSASSRLDQWYVSSWNADWIRDVAMSVPGPVADHNGISIRTDVPSHVVRVRKPRSVYPFPGCAHAVAHKLIIAAIKQAQLPADKTISVPTSDHITARRLSDWCDDWKARLRKVLLATTKTARQGLTKRHRQRLSRLYVRLDAALMVAHTPDTSPPGDQDCCDQPSTTDNPTGLRRNVAECRRLWQRTKGGRLLIQHTYTPGETCRRFYSRVSTKFQINTIVSLIGKAASGPNRSRELADDMADG